MASAAAAAIVSAESILALTPVVIKQSPLDELSAVWSRILTTGVLGYLLAGDRRLRGTDWEAAAALGATNLLHIASSYSSFRNLPAGQAMSLLYTYPLWNLVIGGLAGTERFAAAEYGWMTLAVVGSFLLNTDPGPSAEPVPGRTANPSWGIAMGLVMAITESIMHSLLRRAGWRDPAKSVFIVNGSAGLWLAGVQAVSSFFDGGVGATEMRLRTGSWSDALTLTAFHGVSHFTGYWLRFFAVPRLSVVTYSILSYAGLLASYLFGLVFLGERPGWISLLGAALIVVSGYFLQRISREEDPQRPAEEAAKSD